MSKAALGRLKCQLLHLTWLRHALWRPCLYHIRVFVASQRYFSQTWCEGLSLWARLTTKTKRSGAVEIPRSRLRHLPHSPSSLTLGKITSIATIICCWLQPLSQFSSSSYALLSSANVFLTHHIHNSCGMKWCGIIKCTRIFVGWNLNRASRWQSQPGWMAVSWKLRMGRNVFMRDEPSLGEIAF